MDPEIEEAFEKFCLESEMKRKQWAVKLRETEQAHAVSLVLTFLECLLLGRTKRTSIQIVNLISFLFFEILCIVCLAWYPSFRCCWIWVSWKMGDNQLDPLILQVPQDSFEFAFYGCCTILFSALVWTLFIDKDKHLFPLSQSECHRKETVCAVSS